VLGFEEGVVELGVVERLYRPILQDLLERRQVAGLENIHDERSIRGRELQEAYPTVAGGEGRGLGIHAYELGFFEGLRDGGEVGGGCDQIEVSEAFFHGKILTGDRSIN
jgi:hypothetical protein